MDLYYYFQLQQIDLNQVRYGLALSFMTIASRRILMDKEKSKAILSRIKNYVLIIIGFFPSLSINIFNISYLFIKNQIKIFHYFYHLQLFYQFRYFLVLQELLKDI